MLKAAVIQGWAYLNQLCETDVESQNSSLLFYDDMCLLAI